VSGISRPQLAVYAAAAIAIALIGARHLRSSQADDPAARAPAPRPVQVESAGAGGGWAVVQVVGAVRRPVVYRLRSGGRVNDAVRRAGGPTRGADLAGINLAAKIGDGQQVIVPVRAATAGAAASGQAAAPGQPLSLNTATVEQLDELDGIGPATAQKIVDYRRQHGGFRSVEELDEVPGIGEKKLAALKGKVRV
jgi:competence protein ComEA